MTEIVKQQILAIRATAETNMFDAYAVQYIANREGFYELVVFIQIIRLAFLHGLSDR